MNTLITWNQLREMEEATQNRFNRFLGGFPNRIGTGETHSLTVADWSPEVDISEDDHGYLLKADLPEMKRMTLGLQSKTASSASLANARARRKITNGNSIASSVPL